MKNKTTFIKCPRCGYSYMVGEIFLPKALTGQPQNIIKTSKGEILGYEGSDADLTEKFTCENCLCDFKVEGTMSFKTEAVEDFGDGFFTPGKEKK